MAATLEKPVENGTDNAVDGKYYTKIASCILFTNADHCAFRNCRVHQTY